MYQTLLVPLDGSVHGEHALPLALGLARRAGAALRVVHVHVPYALLASDGMSLNSVRVDARAAEGERLYLEAVAKRLAGVSPVPVTSHFLEGTEVAEALAAEAARGSDLIVMATHGRGPVARFWLGSVADELVRRTPVPLLLVRPEDPAPDLGSEPALRHVLVPLDGSALAERVLGPAVALGGLTGAEYTLVRVFGSAPSAGPRPAGGEPGQEEARLVADPYAEAEAYLARVVQGLRARGLRVQAAAVFGEHPAVTLLDEARARAVDLIALETHGRGGLQRLLLGSVADKVLRGATVPVLVQRAPET